MISAVLLATYVKTWEMYVVCMAVIFPLGIGQIYYTPILCGWEWFPDNKGLVSGIILAGYGFGAFFFGYISTALVNPHDL